jgi:hypothetical protein
LWMLAPLRTLIEVAVAVLMRWVTSSGWETIATWLDGTSMVVAPMRLANRRSVSDGIAWSWVATRYQDGSDLQVGTPITSPNVEPARACCTACMTLARTGSTSAAKCLTKSSSGSQPKPRGSVNRCSSAGGVGPWDSSPPGDSPSSSPKAARYTRPTTFGASVPSAVRIWPP